MSGNPPSLAGMSLNERDDDPMLLPRTAPAGREVLWRNDSTHVKAAAVHAYSFHFDRFMADHARGVPAGLVSRSDLAQPIPEGQLHEYVPMIVFFCPWHLLYRVALTHLPPGSGYDESIIPHLNNVPAGCIGIGLAEHQGARPRCSTAYMYDPSRVPTIPEQNASIAKLAEKNIMRILVFAGVRIVEKLASDKANLPESTEGMSPFRDLSREEINVYDATFSRMMSALYGAMRPLPNPPSKLFHGAWSNEVLIKDMSSDYSNYLYRHMFSASYKEEVAKRFAGQWGVLVTLKVAENATLYGIDMNRTLPDRWRCYDEDEILLAPGHRVTVDTREMEASGFARTTKLTLLGTELIMRRFVFKINGPERTLPRLNVVWDASDPHAPRWRKA